MEVVRFHVTRHCSSRPIGIVTIHHSMAPRKVALSSIKTLTFARDALTTSRRTKAIPQLSCLGKACHSFQPDVVQCQNMGDDGAGGIQWRVRGSSP